MFPVQSAGKGSIILRYRDSASDVSRKAKPSVAENLFNGLQRDGQMVRVAGESKKTVFPVERRGAVVDRLYLDRSKSDLASDAETSVEGVEKEETCPAHGRARIA